MTASSRFGEFELDRSRFELLHKRDNSRMVDKPEVILGRFAWRFVRGVRAQNYSFPLTKTLRAKLLFCGFLWCVFDARLSVHPRSLARTVP
jgi:hypothetical protein